MGILTIEGTFDYQVEEALNKMKKLYNEDDTTLDFDAWVWIHREHLGELFYNAISEWLGFDYIENF